MKKVMLIVLFFMSLGYLVFDIVSESASKKLTKEMIEFESNFNSYYPSIVKLQFDNSYCSGVVVSAMHVLTASHCISLSSKITNKYLRKSIWASVFSSNGEKVVKGKVIAYNDVRDLAVVKGDFSDFQAIEVDQYGQYFPQGIQDNGVFLACGYPWGGPLYCTQVSPFGHSGFWMSFVGMGVYPGMSGGMLVRIVQDVKIDPLTKQSSYVNRFILVGIVVAVKGNYTLVSPTLSLLQSLSLQETQ